MGSNNSKDKSHSIKSLSCCPAFSFSFIFLGAPYPLIIIIIIIMILMIMIREVIRKKRVLGKFS